MLCGLALLLKIANVKLFFDGCGPMLISQSTITVSLILFSDNHAMCLRSTKLLEHFHLSEKGLNYLP